jgi:hypothetical protein
MKNKSKVFYLLICEWYTIVDCLTREMVEVLFIKKVNYFKKKKKDEYLKTHQSQLN